LTEPIHTMKGVAFNQPPSLLLPSISQAMAEALRSVPNDKQGALVGIVTEHGVNAAIVTRFPEEWAVQAWIGKTWSGSDINIGASVMKTW
jgi:hypothetical protein